MHTAIIHEKMYKKWRYVLDKVNNILCYGRIYFKHSIQTLTNFLSIYSRYWFHKRTKIRNTTFFFESSEDHTIFKEVSNTPSREGHIFSIILMDKLMWKILNTELSSTLLVWWVWAWRWSTEVFTGKLKGKSHHEAVGSQAASTPLVATACFTSHRWAAWGVGSKVLETDSELNRFCQLLQLVRNSEGGGAYGWS